MIKSIVKLFLLIAIFNLVYCAKYMPVVRTTSGCVYGKHIEDKNYYSFESIPYAEKPLDDLRFEPPVPYKEKPGYINGTEKPPFCMQWMANEPNSFVWGQEDCLYVNVYTPSVHKCSCQGCYPVIVVIHGGAFMFGQGADMGPEYIMQLRKAVVVTFNYRVGPLGFLSTGDCEVPGNMGLKDQQLALIWIRKNIASFNGCVKNIVLYGFSSGGASTHLHLLNERTRAMDLAQVAISTSGVSQAPWILTSAECITGRTQQLASYMDCPSDSENLKKCLKNKPALDIVSAMDKFQILLYNPFRIFGPVIESFKCKDPFLTEDPNKIIKEKKYPQMPHLITFTRDEGGNAAELLLPECDGKSCVNEFLDNFSIYGPVALFYGEILKENAKNKYTNYLRSFYQLKTDDPSVYFKIQKMFTDELFINDSLDTIRLQRDHSLAPTYHYFYDNPANSGVANVLSKNDTINFGCVHGDDAFLIFKNLFYRNFKPFREDEKLISNNLIEMIINFARTKILKYDEINVPRILPNSKKIQYLHIKRDRAFISELRDLK